MTTKRKTKPAKPTDAVWLLHRDGKRLGNMSYDSEEEARHWARAWFADTTLTPVRYVPEQTK